MRVYPQHRGVDRPVDPSTNLEVHEASNEWSDPLVPHGARQPFSWMGRWPSAEKSIATVKDNDLLLYIICWDDRFSERQNPTKNQKNIWWLRYVHFMTPLALRLSENPAILWVLQDMHPRLTGMFDVLVLASLDSCQISATAKNYLLFTACESRSFSTQDLSQLWIQRFQSHRIK